MYLRRSEVKKNGNTHTYWRLVRSVRRNKKVVQETVAYLGDIDAQSRAAAKDLCAKITGGANQMELWEDNPTPQTAHIRTDLLRLERSRDFGDVWLGWMLWKALQLDTLCASLMPKERNPWHGRQWRPFWSLRDFVNHRANCILPKTGIEKPRLKTFSICRPPAWTTIAFIELTIIFCRTKKLSSGTFAKEWANCFPSITTYSYTM
jgi:hypothetical protein